MAILSMALVSFIPRALPLIAFNKVEFPTLLKKWLGYIPGAVLAALVAPDILMPEGVLDFSLGNIYLLASLPTIMVGIATKSMIWTLLMGMGSFAMIQLFL